MKDDAEAVMLSGVLPADATILGPSDEGWSEDDVNF